MLLGMQNLHQPHITRTHTQAQCRNMSSMRILQRNRLHDKTLWRQPDQPMWSKTKTTKKRHLNLVKKNVWRRDPGEWQKHPPPWRNEEESTTTVVDHPKKRGGRKDAVVSSSLPAVPTVNYYCYNKQLVAQCLCPFKWHPLGWQMINWEHMMVSMLKPKRVLQVMPEMFLYKWTQHDLRM
jgi:hypothetical protein